jgi:hypothetical protein
VRKNSPPASGEDVLAVAERGYQDSKSRDDPKQADQDQGAIHQDTGYNLLLLETTGFYSGH